MCIRDRTFLLFFVTLIVVESRPDSLGGVATALAALILLICWLAYALANRWFARDPVAEPEAFHGVDMAADTEPELKWHRTTWISLAMIAMGLAGMLSGAGRIFWMALPALAWLPATFALLKSNAERSHSGRGINSVLFSLTLAWSVLFLAFVLPWWAAPPFFQLAMRTPLLFA